MEPRQERENKKEIDPLVAQENLRKKQQQQQQSLQLPTLSGPSFFPDSSSNRNQEKEKVFFAEFHSRTAKGRAIRQEKNQDLGTQQKKSGKFEKFTTRK